MILETQKVDCLTDLLNGHMLASPADPLIAILNLALVMGDRDRWLKPKLNLPAAAPGGKA